MTLTKRDRERWYQGVSGRTKLGWVLFGVDGSKIDSKALETLMNAGRQQAERHEAIVRGITEEMWKRIREEEI